MDRGGQSSHLRIDGGRMCREHDGDSSDGEDPVNAEYRVASAGYRVSPGGRKRGVSRSWLRGSWLRRSWLRGSWLRVGGGFSVLAAALFLVGCGYHTSGHAAQLPASVKTISIPLFKNETLTYHIGQMLTASVVREFNLRTRYRIVSDAADDSDATLHGTVLSTVATPLTYDTATGRAASVLVVVSLRVDLSDRNGKVLY